MRARLLPALGLFLALAGLAAAYYLPHKPITPPQAAALANTGLDLAAALALTGLAGGLGRWLGPALRLPAADHPGEQCLLDAALGWGGLGLLMLALGAAGLLYPGLLLAAGLAAGLALRRALGAWAADGWAALRGLWTEGGLARWAALCLALVFTLGLLRALAPPLMWDALVYHLTLPKLYAETNSLRPPVDLMFAGMPQLNEMLFLAAGLLHGPQAAQTLGWCFGAVLALGLAGHSQAQLGPRWGAPAAALLFTAVTLALALAWAYAEMLLMVMGLAVVISLQAGARGGPAAGRWLALAGVYAGLALGCKYTAVIVPAAAGLTILAGLGRRAFTRAGLKDLAGFTAPALSLFAPWLLKNAWLTGNPVFPLAFPTAGMDALQLWFYNRPDRAQFDPAIFLRAIFQGVQGGNAYDATLGPLWAFLPLALAAGWRGLPAEQRAALRVPAVFTLCAYAAWAALTPFSQFAVQARLFFAFFPALALLGMAGLAAAAQFDTPALRVARVLSAGVALVFGLGVLEIGLDFIDRNPLPYLAGRQTAADYRAAQLGWYAPAIDRLNALPAGARVLFLWEPRSLECAPAVSCWPDVIIDRWWHARRTLGGADAILAAWRRQGFTHLLVYSAGVEFVRADPAAPFTAADWEALDALRARLTPVADLDGVYTLYGLNP